MMHQGHYRLDRLPYFENLPPKQGTQHRWVAIATFTVTDDNMAASFAGDDGILDHENLVNVTFGCIDCEEQYLSPRNAACSAPAWQP